MVLYGSQKVHQLLREISDKADGKNVPQIDASEEGSCRKQKIQLTPVSPHRRRTTSSLTLWQESQKTALE